MSHSPGPWTASQASTDILIISSDCRVVARTPLDTAEDKANAAVLKAAPTLLAERNELLAALRGAVSHMDHYIDYDRHPDAAAAVAGYMDIIARAGVKL